MWVRSLSDAPCASEACSSGMCTPMSPVVGFIVPTKAIAAMKTRCWTFGMAIPVDDHQDRTDQEQRAHVVARRQIPDRHGRGGRAEKRGGCDDADLERIEPDLQQVRGRMMAAKPSPNPRRACSVEVEDVRPSACAPDVRRHPRDDAESGNCAIDQSAGVTVKSSKYTWLWALDQRPMRPETGCGRTCSR